MCETICVYCENYTKHIHYIENVQPFVMCISLYRSFKKLGKFRYCFAFNLHLLLQVATSAVQYMDYLVFHPVTLTFQCHTNEWTFYICQTMHIEREKSAVEVEFSNL